MKPLGVHIVSNNASKNIYMGWGFCVLLKGFKDFQISDWILKDFQDFHEINSLAMKSQHSREERGRWHILWDIWQCVGDLGFLNSGMREDQGRVRAVFGMFRSSMWESGIKLQLIIKGISGFLYFFTSGHCPPLTCTFCGRIHNAFDLTGKDVVIAFFCVRMC